MSKWSKKGLSVCQNYNLVNFDSQYVKRTAKKFISTFNTILLRENIVRVDINNSSQCFPDLPSRIPGYADFISETLKPKFEVDELLNMILERLSVTDERLLKLEKLIKESQKK